MTTAYSAGNRQNPERDQKNSLQRLLGELEARQIADRFDVNAKLLALNTENSALKDKITQLMAQNEALQTELASANEDRAHLSDRINTLEAHSRETDRDVIQLEQRIETPEIVYGNLDDRIMGFAAVMGGFHTRIEALENWRFEVIDLSRVDRQIITIMVTNNRTEPHPRELLDKLEAQEDDAMPEEVDYGLMSDVADRFGGIFMPSSGFGWHP